MASSSVAADDSAATVPLSPAPIRAEMVAAAKQFLANPRVRSTPINEQTEFLRGKGLSEAEIQRAMQLTAQGGGGEQVPSTSFSPPPPTPPLPSPPARAAVDLARSALLLGTAAYMMYRFVRSWLLPQLLNVPDPAEERMQRLEQQVERLSESTRCIAESVTQTLVAVTEQNEQLSRTMMMVQGGSKGTVGVADFDRVHAEIGIVKSLLLNQSQFPPVPESAFPRHRRNAQNELNGTDANGTKGKVAKEVNGEAKRSNDGEGEQLGHGQQQNQNGETLNARKNDGSPV